MSVDIGTLRRPYHCPKDAFKRRMLTSRDPFDQFKAWFYDAANHEGVHEPNAMCLATADRDGVPSCRMMLLKEFGPECGFVFYTNYGSRKGRELAENPYAAITIYWEAMKRSVRIEGTVEKVSEEKSDAYFASRPYCSKVGAAVSTEQCSVVPNRRELLQRETSIKEEHGEEKEEKPVPRPHYWGGYSLTPRTFEFWQGQSSRIHDRLRFRRVEDAGAEAPEAAQAVNGWVLDRLQP